MAGVVVDSSFLVAELVGEEHSGFVRSAMRRLVDDALIAPGLLVWEITNVLQKKVRQGRLSPDERTVLLDRLERLAVVLQPTPDLAACAPLLELCDRHGLTTYDAAYLLLATTEDAALASLDDHLVKAARAEGLTVHSPF